MNDYKYLDAAALRGKTIAAISNREKDVINIVTSDGSEYRMWHQRDCCESVIIHDIVGSLDSLIGSPLVVSREESSRDWPIDVDVPDYRDSYTWTTYFFETDTAKVRIRWLGESNGYYSESVQIDQIK